jgi:hypothetical protein
MTRNVQSATSGWPSQRAQDRLGHEALDLSCGETPESDAVGAADEQPRHRDDHPLGVEVDAEDAVLLAAADQRAQPFVAVVHQREQFLLHQLIQRLGRQQPEVGPRLFP